MKHFEVLVILLFCLLSGKKHFLAEAKIEDPALITNYTVNLVKTQHVVIFACHRQDVLRLAKNLNQFFIVLPSNNKQTLEKILTHRVYAKTAVIVDCGCTNSTQLLRYASDVHYFNKTYQWLLWDSGNVGLEQLLPNDLQYLGPNAQITYVNSSIHAYQLWDVHSKGLHLLSALEVVLLASKPHALGAELVLHQNIFHLQSIRRRDKFNGLTLRGASVIDQENVTTNAQVEHILSRVTKDSGVAAFSKYHYELLNILRERLNFTVNFRNARGWAGRLGNTRYRLGFLGIMMRNEADIGASGAFNRINRFAEFDIIHQSWKFETAFLYRFTPDLDTHGKSGNFLAPFDDQVWFFAIATLLVVNTFWRLVAYINKRSQLQQQAAVDETSFTGVSLQTFAAICQQGLDPIPKGLTTRTIILTTFLFSLVMYNYYTSSVVGGLLSSTARGPATVDEVVSSPLQLSFEDIGYYKVLFRVSTVLTRISGHSEF